ncbi:MAG: fluoride efflux transporter CrcB [Phycisphaeraceae bacterium]|nr:fluoride efflux transporter CrcB [Phycisphaeraceae bacterium]
MTRWLLIFLGGGAGSLLRYALAGLVQKLSPGSFPLGTLIVNVAGCAAIGILASLFTGPVLIRDDYRFAILVGILGGFTTFSTFSWETIALSNSGQMALAWANILLSNGLGLAAAWLGNRAVVIFYGT